MMVSDETYAGCIRLKGHEGEHSWKDGDAIDFDQDTIILCWQPVRWDPPRILIRDDEEGRERLMAALVESGVSYERPPEMDAEAVMVALRGKP